MSEVTDLVVIEKQNAMAVFTTKEQLDPIIEAIEKEARSMVPDVSTRKGRDAIASMAHRLPVPKPTSTTPARIWLLSLKPCRSRSTKVAALCVSGWTH